MAERDVADMVAQEIASWIETRATQVAEALLGSPLRPQVVQPSRADTLAYFEPLFFNPDSTPNAVGRQQVMDQYGAAEYEEIALALVREARKAQED